MDVIGLQKRQTPGRETRGVDVAGGQPIRFACNFSVMESLRDCSSPVKHPNTLGLIWTGKLRADYGLNPHRGSQPVGTRRVVGKREWQRESVKSRRQQDGSVSHQSLHELLQAYSLCTVQNSPSVIGGKRCKN